MSKLIIPGGSAFEERGRAANYRWQVKENVRAGLVAFQTISQQRAERAMEVACVVVESSAKGKLKWRNRRGIGLGGRASGHLARYAHTVKTIGMVTEGTIGPTVHYAKYVEGYPQPPRRHFTSAPGLIEWVWRHTGKRVTGMIVGGAQGTTPHLGPAMREVGPRAMARLAEAMRF